MAVLALAGSGPAVGGDASPTASSDSSFWTERGLGAASGALPDPSEGSLDAFELEEVARDAIASGKFEVDYRVLIYAPDLIDVELAAELLSEIRLGRLDVGAVELAWWKEQGLDHDTALRRPRLETLAGILSSVFSQHDPDYTSLTIDPSNQSLVILRSGERASALVEGVRHSALSPHVRFAVSEASRNDLMREIVRIVDEMEADGVKRDFGMWIDPGSGRLVLELEGAAHEAERVTEALKWVGPSFRPLVDVRFTTENTEPAAALIGGLSIANSGGCEMAFAVSGVVGPGTTTATGIVTAAHCGNAGQYPAGTSLPFVREYGSGTGQDETDAQFHTKGSGNTVDNRIRYTSEGSPPGTLFVDITSRTGWAGQTPPQTVCHNGSSTNVRTCGVIESNTYTPSSVVSADPEWIRVVMRSCLGDSGASIWRRNSAYGILHAISGSAAGTCTNGQERREKTVYGAVTFAESRL